MDNVLKSLKNDSHSLLYKYADTSLDELKKESIDNGINFNGVDGLKTAYSRVKIPAWIRGKHILNAAGAFAVKFVEMQSWGDFRLVQGLKSRYINLKYTGEHWDSYDIISSKGKVYVIYYGDLDKISQLSERYGEYYTMTDKMLEKGHNQMKIDFYNSLIKRL